MVVPFWTPITPLAGSFLHADPQVGVCSDCVDRFGHLIVSDRHVDRSRLNRLMPHQMLNRFDPNASLVKSSAEAASTAVTARFDRER